MLTALCFWNSRNRWLRVLSSSVTVFYYLLTIPLTANWVLGALEATAARERTCGPPPAGSVLIVLAGGVSGDPDSATDFADLKAESIHRLLSGAQLALRTPDSVLVVSGGAGGRYREADLMANLAEQMGLPRNRIIVDRKSTTTYQSAVNVGTMLAGSHAPRYMLTSAYHMPRAFLAFRQSGQPVCAWPVDFRAIAMPPYAMLTPQLSALEKMSRALHEWLGLWFYRWLKWR
ncbi:MAG: YdcF family protein [Gammaproteobacteria bacterium]|nr:YdcF family protein [Gammaproteobacteria bacterium]